ncbi:MAG: hypothetical protein RL268_1891 [Pseudomonadota bacterium]
MHEWKYRRKISVMRWCPGPESNQRHADFQATLKRSKTITCQTASVKLVAERQSLSGGLSNRFDGLPTPEIETPATVAAGAGAKTSLDLRLSSYKAARAGARGMRWTVDRNLMVEVLA